MPHLHDCALLLLAASCAGCLMTADQTLWQRHDASRDRTADLRQDSAPDHASAPDRTPDRAGDRPGADAPGADRPHDTAPTPDQCSTQQLVVAGPSDDGEVGDNFWFVNGESAGIFIGYYGAGSEWGYFRFALAQPLKPGATIVEARLSLTGTPGATSWDPSTHALQISLEDSADATAVSGDGDLPFTGGRTTVSGFARWPASGGLTWLEGQENLSPNLASLVQALVSKQGLAKGSHLQLWIRADQAVGADVVALDYSQPGFASRPTRLTITSCP